MVFPLENYRDSNTHTGILWAIGKIPAYCFIVIDVITTGRTPVGWPRFKNIEPKPADEEPGTNSVETTIPTEITAIIGVAPSEVASFDISSEPTVVDIETTPIGACGTSRASLRASTSLPATMLPR